MTLAFTSNPATFGVTTPPPFDPVVISGFTEASLSPTSELLGWSCAPGAQAQVEYGLTGGYGLTTALEASFLVTHSQTITGLAPGTLYRYRVRAISATGANVYSAERTFTTASDTSGITYVRTVTWPTGPGYTSGTPATVRANLQALIVSGGSGTNATNRVLHDIPAGAIYTIDTALDFSGLDYLTFRGNGVARFTTVVTPRGNLQITAAGNTGGALMRTTSVYPANTSTAAIFSSMYGNLGPSTYRATDISFTGLNFEGNNPAVNINAITMADGGNEVQHGIAAFGVDGLEVAYCGFAKLKGDCVALQGSAGSTASDPADVRTRNVNLHHNEFGEAGRVGVFLGKCSAVRIADNLYRNAAYAFIDFEPDYFHMYIGTTDILRNTFAGRCNWDTTFYMSSIYLTRIIGRPGTHVFDGPITIANNVWNDLHSRNPGSVEVETSYGDVNKTGAFIFRDNERIANRHPGPVLRLAGFQAGWTITGNGDFMTGFGGSFVADAGGNSGTLSASGNT